MTQIASMAGILPPDLLQSLLAARQSSGATGGGGNVVSSPVYRALPQMGNMTIAPNPQQPPRPPLPPGLTDPRLGRNQRIQRTPGPTASVNPNPLLAMPIQIRNNPRLRAQWLQQHGLADPLRSTPPNVAFGPRSPYVF